jgi:hypothetical protein
MWHDRHLDLLAACQVVVWLFGEIGGDAAKRDREQTMRHWAEPGFAYLYDLGLLA